MIHFLTNRKKSTSGFTLIELLVVIAIIGVLASVVLASLNTARRKSRDARRIADIKQIQLALELFFDGAGLRNYPLGTVAATCTAASQHGLEALVTNNYIPQMPRDPQSTLPTNGCYDYSASSAVTGRTSYHLGAVLEETTNGALTGDKDAAATAGWQPPDFSGLSIGTGLRCFGGVVGTPQPGTELCYDVVP
ncbi:MAG: type II secretion system protein [Candidatus Sungbacteria bacterium]|nr:type II secretion system protein [bacterium]MDZ4260227.1 type II secretion system protein [Candidatus Sungbacteria bacterium]